MCGHKRLSKKTMNDLKTVFNNYRERGYYFFDHTPKKERTTTKQKWDMKIEPLIEHGEQAIEKLEKKFSILTATEIYDCLNILGRYFTIENKWPSLFIKQDIPTRKISNEVGEFITNHLDYLSLINQFSTYLDILDLAKLRIQEKTIQVLFEMLKSLPTNTELGGGARIENGKIKLITSNVCLSIDRAYLLFDPIMNSNSFIHWHTHSKKDNNFSTQDKSASEFLRIPLLLFSEKGYEDFDAKLFVPTSMYNLEIEKINRENKNGEYRIQII